MSTNENYVRVGADPEMFVRRSGGEVIPVCGLVGGTKEAPKPLPVNEYLKSPGDMGNFAIQEDGVALEFNIPATTRGDSFAGCIRHAIKSCKSIARSRGLDLVFSPSHEFRSEQLKHPSANRIGCSADQSAYIPDGGMRQPYSALDFGNHRFAGGHLHLGYNTENIPHKIMARYMDLYVGLPSVYLDKQGPRRQYYGGPGLYREKPYGIEYRTLSNFWLQERFVDNDYLIYLSQTVLDLGIFANTRPEILAMAYDKIPWDDVSQSISTENENLANEIYAYVSSVLRLPMRYWQELAGPKTESRSDRIKINTPTPRGARRGTVTRDAPAPTRARTERA